MREREYILGFAVFPGVGPKRFQQLMKSFDSAESAWYAEKKHLLPVLGNAYTEKFLLFRTSFSHSDYVKQLQAKQVWFVTYEEGEYPELLSGIENPPLVLFGRGDKGTLTLNSSTEYIGIVGSRKVTAYGKTVTEMITEELVAAGCIIVSGLALGVDAVAHEKTVALQGKTIAVLGSGVDICHPMTNFRIYNSIITSGGAVVSEYPLGEAPSRGSFPARNRIIAGLCNGIVVTEGAADSGALITAKDASAIGRQVYAVPGPVTSTLSKGPNLLLTKNAKLVTSGRDILQDIGITLHSKGNKRDTIVGETVEEQSIISLLHDEALQFDELVKRVTIDSAMLGTVLSIMEVKGYIEMSEGRYRLRS